MQLYSVTSESGANECIIVGDGAVPPNGLTGLPVFCGRVYDIDFAEAQMQDIQGQMARQRYARLDASPLSKLLIMLEECAPAANEVDTIR